MLWFTHTPLPLKCELRRQVNRSALPTCWSLHMVS